MDDYRTKITALEREIEENEAAIDKGYGSIGEQLHRKHDQLLSGKQFKELQEELKNLSREIDASSKEVSRIQSIQKRQEENREKSTAAHEEIKQLQKEAAGLYEDIGRAAFAVYKENPFIDQTFVDIFSDLVRNQEDLAEIENDLARFESELAEKSFLDKMVAKGKVALLRNRQAAKENNVPRLLRKAGEEVCNTNFVHVVDNEELTKSVEPYTDLNAKIEKVEKRITAISSDQDELAGELEQMCGNKKPGRRISELEQAIESYRDSLGVTYGELGRTFVSQLKKDAEIPADIQPIVEKNKKLDRENNNKSRHIDRLNAAIQIQRLTRDISDMQGRIESLEEQIQHSQSRIAELQNMMDQADKEKKQLEKTRGAVEKL